MKYRTICADPPWRYSQSRITTTGKQRRAEALAHYNTMPLEDICALPVGDLAEDDAHLYLWVTCPLLFWAKDVIEAWGFEYRTLITWEKQGTLGMGFHFRVQTEHVVFATRGSLPIAAADRRRNIFAAPKRAHSAKPDCFYDLVEQVSPGPYVELFARRARFGWDYYGDESLGTIEMPTANGSLR
jgi:N6-adenosine-specific RNA methylase IME4